MENSIPSTLEWTGERMVPEVCDNGTFSEHAERYRFAARFVNRKEVVDIACGEGYGSAAMLKGGAASVVGIDISEDTCRHAREKHGIDARVGDAEDIPLKSLSADVIVSFETIEHVKRPDRFLSECARVLRPDGLIIMSTPNRDIYRHMVPDYNPFHCSELSLAEFQLLLSQSHLTAEFYGQHPVAPWYLSLKGVRRYVPKIRRAFLPGLAMDLNCSERAQTLDTILRRRSFLEGILNLMAVRKLSRERLANAKFIVAVARNSKSTASA